MKVNNTLTFEGSIDSSEEFNSNWIRARLKVFAFGGNRNGSSFSQNSFSDKAQKSLSHIPIVAKYNKETDNLEGHNIKLTRSKDGEYDLYRDTSPFGTTGSDTVASYQEVNEGSEDSPIIKTYVTIDNVYLWRRYEATKKIEEWISEGIIPKISMEIDEVEGNLDPNGFFQIEDFIFTAIAALGSDVEPCFPRAEIETYSKKGFNDEFNALVFELNETLQHEQKGGTKMEETQTTELEFDAATEATTETPAEEVETEVEVFEVETTEVVEEIVEDVVEEPVVEEVEVVDYEAKFNDLNSEFSSIQSELEELKSYKRNREEDDMKSKFADKLSDDEMTEVFTAMKEASIEDVEVKLFAMYGKKNFSVVAKPSNTTLNKVILPMSKSEETTASPFDILFEKFKK